MACTLEDNSNANVVSVIVSVKKKDESPVPDELVQLENRGGEF